jgi:hypothetical protein
MPVKNKPSTRGISHHFERESKVMAGLPFVLMLIGLLAALVGPWVMHRLDISRCHKAGGSLNSETGDCVMNNTRETEPTDSISP